MTALVNLETIAAKFGHDIANAEIKGKKVDTDVGENTVTHSLDVLAANGFYALHIYLLSCNQKEYGKEVARKLRELLAQEELGLLEKSDIAQVSELKCIREITADLPRLILARQVTEAALTFARYHLKARSKDKSATTAEASA